MAASIPVIVKTTDKEFKLFIYGTVGAGRRTKEVFGRKDPDESDRTYQFQQLVFASNEDLQRSGFNKFPDPKAIIIDPKKFKLT